MEHTPLAVSVVIPTYNRPDLIGGAVQSVLDQTFQDFEIIVVDDGTEKRAEAAVAAFADKRIRYIKHEERRGGAAARNTGAAAARASLIAFLDDDDAWVPEKLERQCAVLKECGERIAFVYCLVEQHHEDDGRVVVQPPPRAPGAHNFYEELLAHKVRMLTSSMVIRKTAFDAVGGFDETLSSSQEWELMIRVSEKHDGYCIPEPLVKMRVLSGEHIGGNVARRIAGREKLVEKHLQALKQRPAALAHHYFQLGVFYRDMGEIPKARHYFLLSWRLVPQWPRPLAHYFSLFSNGLLYRLMNRIR